MATRRIISSDKGALDVDQSGSSIAATEKSDITPAVPAPVIYKLLAFTAAMVVVPIGSYFVTVDTIFAGNSTYAGATAAILANVVLIGYVFVAIAEDKSDQQAAAKKGKKAQ